MRGKSILALAVALAMIFSVIPAFGLTASAASVGEQIPVNGIIYNVLSDNLVYNGDFSQINVADGVTTVKNWTAGYVNNVLQDLSTAVVSTGLWGHDGRSGMPFTYTAKSDESSAYITTPVWDIQENNNYPYSPDDSCGFATINNWIKDESGEYVKAEAGKQYYLSFKTKVSGEHEGEQWVSFGAYKNSGDDYKNARPGRFDVAPFKDTAVLENAIVPTDWLSEKDVWKTVETVATATDEGYFAFQCTWAQDYGTESFTDFVIYEVEPAPISTAATVKEALDKIEVASMVKGDSVELAKTVTDVSEQTYDVTWTSDSEVISSEGVVTPAENVVTVNLTPSAQFGGQTVTGEPKSVTVFPAPLAGTTYVASDGVYTVDSVNAIGENADFSQGFTGWTVGDGSAMSDAGFTLHTVNDVNYISSNNADQKGAATAYAIKQSVTIENGEKYLFAFTGNLYNSDINFFRVDVGNGEVTPGYVKNNGWERQTYIFEAASEKLAIAFRWIATDASFESFELYKLTQQEEVLSSVKNPEAVSLASGEDVKTVLPTQVEATYSKGTVKKLDVEWETDELDFTNDQEDAKTVTVKGKVVDGAVELDVSIDVKVYHVYAVEGSYENGTDQYGNKTAVSFPATTKTLAAEFDVVFESFGDLWIQINDSSVVNDNFGKGCKVGLGFNGSGALRPVDGNGEGGRNKADEDAGFLKAGETYKFIVNVNVAENKYDAAAYNANSGEFVGSVEGFGFRGASEKLDVLHLFTNGGGKYTASNIKFTYGTIAVPETVDVTVEYYTDADMETEPAKTVTKKVVPNIGDVEFDAVEPFVVDGVVYESDAVTVSDITEAVTKKVVLTPAEGIAIASEVFTMESGAPIQVTGKWADGDTYNAMFVVSWNGSEPRRTGYAKIPMAAPEATSTTGIGDATLHLTVFMTQGEKASADVYLADPTKVNSTSMTDQALLDKIGTITTNSNGTDGSGKGEYTVSVDATLLNAYFATYDTDALYIALVQSNNGLSTYGAGYGLQSPYIEWTEGERALGVELLKGAQVRIGKSYADSIAEDSGLRFIGTVNKEGTLAGLENAEISVKITAAGNETDEVNIPINDYQDADKTIFTAVLTNLKETNYNRVFTATPVVTINGEAHEGTPVSRSIFEVAAGILVDGVEAEVDSKEYKVVEEVLNAYVNAVGVRFEIARETGAVTNENDYNFGKDTPVTAFEVTVDEANGDGEYLYTIKPQGKIKVPSVEALLKSIRINNNNKAVVNGIDEESVNIADDGTITFKFTVANAVAE